MGSGSQRAPLGTRRDEGGAPLEETRLSAFARVVRAEHPEHLRAEERDVPAQHKVLARRRVRRIQRAQRTREFAACKAREADAEARLHHQRPRRALRGVLVREKPERCLERRLRVRGCALREAQAPERRVRDDVPRLDDRILRLLVRGLEERYRTLGERCPARVVLEVLTDECEEVQARRVARPALAVAVEQEERGKQRALDLLWALKRLRLGEYAR